jgi:ribokinase
MRDSANAPSITVVGSYNVGFTFRAARLPVPGETLLGDAFHVGPGGKGSNQAIGAARLGAHTRLVACVGEDRYGNEAIALWQTEGVDATHVRRAPTHTGAGVILLDAEGDNAIVVAPGANQRLTASDVDAAQAAFDGAAVVLAQLEIALATVECAAAQARRVGARFILNPAPATELPERLVAQIDVLTPNETELAILSGLPPGRPYDPESAASRLVARGVGAVVVTRGAAGALIVTVDSRQTVSAPRVQVVDTTGAGDAFNAALSVALAEGKSLISAVEFACRAGAFAVTRDGVIPALPTRSELETGLLPRMAT